MQLTWIKGSLAVFLCWRAGARSGEMMCVLSMLFLMVGTLRGFLPWWAGVAVVGFGGGSGYLQRVNCFGRLREDEDSPRRF